MATVPADAFKDQLSFDWVTSPEDSKSVTLNMYNDLVRSTLEKQTATGGLTGWAAINGKQSGFAKNSESDLLIETDEDKQYASSVLEKMEQ